MKERYIIHFIYNVSAALQRLVSERWRRTKKRWQKTQSSVDYAICYTKLYFDIVFIFLTTCSKKNLVILLNYYSLNANNYFFLNKKKT